MVRHNPVTYVTAERGPEKVECGRRWGRRKLSVVTDGATGKRSAVRNFYPYGTRISSHNLPLATVCIEYAAYMLSIYNYKTPILNSLLGARILSIC